MNKAQIEFLRRRIESILHNHREKVEKKFPLKDALSSRKKVEFIRSGRARIKKLASHEDMDRYTRAIDLFTYPGDGERARFNTKQEALREKAMQPALSSAARLLDQAALVDGSIAAIGLQELASMRV